MGCLLQKQLMNLELEHQLKLEALKIAPGVDQEDRNIFWCGIMEWEGKTAMAEFLAEWLNIRQLGTPIAAYDFEQARRVPLNCQWNS